MMLQQRWSHIHLSYSFRKNRTLKVDIGSSLLHYVQFINDITK